MTRKALEKFKIEKTEELERKLRFLTVINRSFRKLSDYEEEKDVRKITRKTMKEIEDFKVEIKRIKKSKNEIIKHKTSKLLYDLKFEKGFEIDEIKKMEEKLEKLKIGKRVIDTIKTSIITNEFCEYYD